MTTERKVTCHRNQSVSKNTPSCNLQASLLKSITLSVVECPSTMPPVQKSTKKRLASSQDGPKAKKTHIAKQTISKHRDETVKKRRQPVTLPVKEINEEDSDQESGDVDSGEENAEQSPVNDEMDVDNELSKDTTNGPPLGALTVLIILMHSIISR